MLATAQTSEVVITAYNGDLIDQVFKDLHLIGITIVVIVTDNRVSLLEMEGGQTADYYSQVGETSGADGRQTALKLEQITGNQGIALKVEDYPKDLREKSMRAS